MFYQTTAEDKISEAMNFLSPEYKEILILVSVKSLRYAQVSEVLGIPLSEARTRLSKARQALQTILEAPVPGQRRVRYMPPRQLGFVPAMAQAA